MPGPWPWLAVAGVGALHGLNPAMGWGLVAGRFARGAARPPAWRALAPIALGHAASVALVVALAASGTLAQRGLLPWLAGGLALFAAALHVATHLPPRVRRAAASAGLASWSLAMGLASGAGMMLVPTLVPLCVSGAPGREITASGSTALALAAVVLHLAAMLATAAVAARIAGWSWRALCHRRRAGA
jgi:hypothetical protein